MQNVRLCIIIIILLFGIRNVSHFNYIGHGKSAQNVNGVFPFCVLFVNNEKQHCHCLTDFRFDLWLQHNFQANENVTLHSALLYYCFMLCIDNYIYLNEIERKEKNISYRIHHEPNQMCEWMNFRMYFSWWNVPFKEISRTHFFFFFSAFKQSRHASYDKKSMLWLKVAHTHTQLL